MTDENVVPITAADGTARKKVGPAPDRPLFPSPDAPLDVARELYKAFHDAAGLRTLVCHRGDWMRWTGQQWTQMDTAQLRSAIYTKLGEVDYDRPVREKGVVVDYERTRWNPNRNKVANVIEAMSAVGHLSASIDAPTWIGAHTADSPASRMIACTNGLLSLATRALTTHTPALYNVVGVPFDYQANAPKPVAWLKFLHSVWPDDPASIDLLQEWAGYIISGRTDMQKILLLIGPTRSGKGTGARVITNLIGRGNVTGPTLASLGTNFGLAPLLGKPLAIIADARLGNAPTHTIVERLLSISGEDMLTVDRKFKDPWSGKLPTRLMVLSNEIPRFTDASGAIANRLLIVQMKNSFLGREDRTLDRRLTDELPGILNWALEGLDRLTSKGRFTVPSASNQATTMLMDLASPVSAFVRDCCIQGAGESVERDRLYGAWKLWCFDSGHEAGAKATFGRNLAAVVPDLGTAKPRIGGIQIRCYTSIGLLGASPASHGVYAVQDTIGEADVPDSAQGTFFGEARADASPHTTNPQVRTSEAGEAPKIPSKTQHESGRPKISCQKWFNQHIAELRAAGHVTADSFAVNRAGEAEGYTRGNISQAVSAHPDVLVVDRTSRGATWSITGDRQSAYVPATEFFTKYLENLPTEVTQIDQDHYQRASAAAGYGWEAASKAATKHPRIESVPAVGNSRNERVWLIHRDGKDAS